MWFLYKSELFFLIVCILIIILRSICRVKDVSNKMFIRGVYFALIIASINLLENFLPYDTPDIVHYVIYIIYYVVWVAIPFNWFLTVLDKVYYKSFFRDRNFRKFASVPIGVIFVLGLLTPFYGTLFKLNLFSDPIPGTFSAAITVSICFYVGLTMAFSLYRFFFNSKTEDRKIAGYMLLSSPIITALQLNSTFNRNGYFIIALTISISILYINMHEDKVFLDPLTGLNNRNRFRKYINSILSSSSNKVNMYLTYVDIDEFKKINDNYGHLTGDLALRTVSEALLDVCNVVHQCFIARIGGDEFVIISSHQNEDSLNSMLSHLDELLKIKSQKNLSKITVGFSVGTTSLNIPHLTATEAIKLADRNMYIDKTAKKAELNKEA